MVTEPVTVRESTSALAERLRASAIGSERFILGLAGAPGAGKSTQCRLARLACSLPSLAMSSARFSDSSWSPLNLVQLPPMAIHGGLLCPPVAQPPSISSPHTTMTAFMFIPLVKRERLAR